MHPHRHGLAWLALPFALALPIIACGQATVTTQDSPTAPAATPAGGGGKIGFASGRQGEYEIYTVAPDGTGTTQLTNSDPGGKYFPRYSADGQVLLYWDYVKDPASSDEYWLKSDGTTGLFANTVQPYVSFSPDGHTVALCTNGPNGSVEIVTIPSAGGKGTWLTDNAAKDYMPAWSPDGKTIAFVSDRDGLQYIYLMDPDGGNPRRLSTNEYPELSPAWSPDGSRLAFFSGNNDVTNIFVAGADGTGSVNITKQDTGFNEDPTWSPDGTMLAFWSSRSGDNEIYTIGADGSGVTNLTNSPGPDENPSWSR
jgi:tol-pal system beta propeller repeat protein TolB